MANNLHWCEDCEEYVLAHEHITLDQYKAIVDRAIQKYVKRHRVKKA